MTAPNPSNRRQDTEYFVDLVGKIKARHGGTDSEVAAAVGIGYSTLRDGLKGRAAVSYPVQYALEQLLRYGYPANT